LRFAEEVDVLRVRAGPAALDVGHAVLVEEAGDAQLVGEGERDVLALRAVAERRVVQDDGLAHEAAPAEAATTRDPSWSTMASVMARVPTTRRPAAPPSGGIRSAVRRPSSIAAPTAASTSSAALAR